jgi:hypothetical protein
MRSGLHYAKGQYRRMIGHFRFQKPDYNPFFLKMREIYKRQIKG